MLAPSYPWLMETFIHFFSWDAGRQANTGQKKASLSVFKLKEKTETDRECETEKQKEREGKGRDMGVERQEAVFHDVLSARRYLCMKRWH